MLDVVVGCTRKTEVRLWRYLFQYAGRPKDLFEQCMERGMLKSAGGYLLVLHTLEHLKDSSEVNHGCPWSCSHHPGYSSTSDEGYKCRGLGFMQGASQIFNLFRQSFPLPDKTNRQIQGKRYGKLWIMLACPGSLLHSFISVVEVPGLYLPNKVRRVQAPYNSFAETK